MHVVRNVVPIRKVFPVYLCRRPTSAATTTTQSVIRRHLSSKSHVNVADTSETPLLLDPAVSQVVQEFGFEPFKQFVSLQPKSDNTDYPPLGKTAKKKIRKRLQYHAEALARSGDVVSHRKHVANDILNTLQRLRRPVVKKEESTPGVNLTKGKEVKQKSSVLSNRVDGWKGEEWGSDVLHPKKDDFDKKIRSNDAKQSPPHLRAPLSYTRRLEGLLSPLESPILEDVEQISEHRPIATLKHDLDRVLFNPGVHWLQDPRTGVFNFTPWLEHIPEVENFAFDRLRGFIKSSRDKDLWALAKRENRLFGGSTSSLTGMLSHIYFLISGDKDVDISSLSQHFQHQPTDFTPGQRMAASVLLNYNDGVYAVDSLHDGDDPEKNVLTWMGTMLEKFLTMSREDFSRLLRDSANPLEPDTDPQREAYRYAKSTRFVMRSQLDCHDSRLPGTGTFDLKTRGVLPIRLDVLNYQEYSGYMIRTLQGPIESFEKEYYDLIRSAFLKYSFQARIGNMDGVLVAHHNASRIFGFQYIPLSEMEAKLYGDPSKGERVFEKCVSLQEEVMLEIIGCFPSQSVRCLTETRMGVMTIWVEPEAHDEDMGRSRPIIQLDVECTSYLEEEVVRGSTAVSSDRPWIIHWSISRSSLTDEEKRAKKQGAEDRRFRAWNLPTGVNFEEMELLWNQIDYGGQRRDNRDDKTSHIGPPFDPASFRHPSSNIEMLRQLSKEGRVYAADLMLNGMGKPKVILGGPHGLDVDASQSLVTIMDDDFTDHSKIAPPPTPLPKGVEELSYDQESSLAPPSLEGVSDFEAVVPNISDTSSSQPSQSGSTLIAETEIVSLADSKDSINESSTSAEQTESKTADDPAADLRPLESSSDDESPGDISRFTDFTLITDAGDPFSTKSSKHPETSISTTDYNSADTTSDPSYSPMEAIDADMHNRDSLSADSEPLPAETPGSHVDLESTTALSDPSGPQSSHDAISPDFDETTTIAVKSHNETEEVSHSPSQK